MKQYRCIECFSIFNDNSLESDMLLCPSCGGHLEEGAFEKDNTSGDRYTNDEDQKRYFNSHNDGASEIKRIHTHYDNLKVSRKAPPEVIRAAYRALSQKHHPDKNAGNAECERIMAIINASYDVLSDPDKRRAHDLWIIRQEQGQAQTTESNNQAEQAPTQTPGSQPTSSTAPSKSRNGGVIAHVLKNWRAYGAATFFIWLIFINNTTHKPVPGPKAYQSNPPSPVPSDKLSNIVWDAPPARPAYVRPRTAPNGNPWPTSAGYLKGYQRLRANGLSTVTIDNSQNNSDVFVKLIHLDLSKAYPVRQFYIPAYGKFTVNKVTSGSYDIRYRDLDSGVLSRAEAFDLEEIPTEDGTQYSTVTMTLYKVRNGNMQTYGLSEEEF